MAIVSLEHDKLKKEAHARSFRGVGDSVPDTRGGVTNLQRTLK